MNLVVGNIDPIGRITAFVIHSPETEGHRFVRDIGWFRETRSRILRRPYLRGTPWAETHTQYHNHGILDSHPVPPYKNVEWRALLTSLLLLSRSLGNNPGPRQKLSWPAETKGCSTDEVCPPAGRRRHPP